MTLRPVKVGVIGGGSVFTPELVDLLARSYREMPVKEMVLMDINLPRVEILLGIAQRIVARAGVSFPIRVTQDYQEAIKDADYILIQLRAGDQAGRITDEKIGLKYRVPFVETVSVCGLGTFLRSIKIYEDIAGLIRTLAPNAYVMNFANPAGPLTEYLLRLGISRTIGVCNVPVILGQYLGDIYHEPPEAFYMQTRGLNHLTVTDAIYLDGRDILPDLLPRVEPYKFPMPFSHHVIEAFPAVFNPYYQYYFHGQRIMNKLLQAEKTRGEEVLQIEQELLRLYSDPAVDQVPDLLRSRGGFGYSLVVVRLMLSLYRNDDTIHYVNVRNNGVLAELPDDTAVEIPVMIKQGRVLPIETGPLPHYAAPLIITMAEYYRLLLDAAQERSKKALRQALLVHPLFPDADMSDQIIDEMLEINRDYLPASFS
ncbi:glycoside hydrolase family protein [Sulfobacillus acidophilus TPY]|uniref:6-phospho-beta-glucosidase n=1 Tax=Sulfobacillus acidophilus (strain ATCC 700253 / DSM 10332 / NAL) TaxID=679936 RepID=G8TTM2_SULAD|nr:glycoside hydrolase family protein [Sulfobacillus acidophilus TPY]AEW05688.1 6-phospho-beta-glucosidase [Sulfobacillus acidophilus DSM 10332]